VNILLFGIGGEGHDGPTLTDTIMITSIKPSTGQIALISIPRDMSVKIPGVGYYKVNHASYYGQKAGKDGPAYAAEILSDTLNVDLPYNAQVDFQAFSEIIDYVGGIAINVERPFTDTKYPTNNETTQTISFAKGEQNMDGATALKFVRSRHGDNSEGSDFARAKRQQKIISALKTKIMSASTLANPIRISKIIESLTKHVSTNLQFADLMYLLKLSRQINTNQIITVVFDDGPKGFLKATTGADGAYLLEPKSGNYEEMSDYIKNIFTVENPQINDTPAQTLPPTEAKLPPANIEIQNGTWTAGLAAKIKKDLEEKGIIILSLSNSDERPQTKGGIYNISEKDMTDQLQKLQSELNLPIKKDLPTGVKAATTTDILILLGEDTIE
jgi:LCP family protein required for cell wall assembly